MSTGSPLAAYAPFQARSALLKALMPVGLFTLLGGLRIGKIDTVAYITTLCRRGRLQGVGAPVLQQGPVTVAGAPGAEPEVVAHQQPPYVAAVEQDALDELGRIQLREAQWWRDASVAYFQSVSGRPLPVGEAAPPHPLAWYQALQSPSAPGDGR